MFIMFKIFIDTNIFLDFYRYNKNDNISNLKDEFKKYFEYFINTKQSYDEFFRNREKTINEFIDTLKSQINPLYDGNFLSSLNGFEDYYENMKLANKSIKCMIDKCSELIFDFEKDPVYSLYLLFCHNTYDRTRDIIDRAIKRKYIGNPPTSNKNTCCDEIIWESILENCHDDLIIVTRDKTFNENYNFLKNEYNEKNGKKLLIVELISDAIRLLGDDPSNNLETIEKNILLEKEVLEYEVYHEKSNWVNIVYEALQSLGGVAYLSQIYDKVYDIIENDYPEKLTNKDIKATIRGILQRYCSDSTSYNNKADLFKKIKNGVWSIK